jgi:hypothetical protein
MSVKKGGMIPSDRPVVGRDLDTIRQQHSLLTADACWLFGISITKWTQVVRQAPDVPVADPTLALLVRFLDEHPELAVIPKFPSPDEMMTLVNDAQETDKRRFSVLFGSQFSAAYRWSGEQAGRPSGTVSRLMHWMQLELLRRQPAERSRLLEEWSKTVAQEGITRGVPDVFTTGSWNPAGATEISEEISGGAKGAEPTLRKARVAVKGVGPSQRRAKKVV